MHFDNDLLMIFLNRFVRGDAMTEEDHWPKLFHMLEMPQGLKLKSLTLQHFLDEKVAALLQARQNQIKVCL